MGSVSKQDILEEKEKLQAVIEKKKKGKKGFAAEKKRLASLEHLLSKIEDGEKVTIADLERIENQIETQIETHSKKESNGKSKPAKKRKAEEISDDSIDFSQDDEYRNSLQEIRKKCKQLIHEFTERDLASIEEEEAATCLMVSATVFLRFNSDL
jgi:hypothetical protein